MWFALVARRGPIMFPDNARSLVARMTLQKFTDLGYKTLPRPQYFPNLSLTDSQTTIFFQVIESFLHQKTFRSKVEIAFKDFLESGFIVNI